MTKNHLSLKYLNYNFLAFKIFYAFRFCNNIHFIAQPFATWTTINCLLPQYVGVLCTRVASLERLFPTLNRSLNNFCVAFLFWRPFYPLPRPILSWIQSLIIFFRDFLFRQPFSFFHASLSLGSKAQIISPCHLFFLQPFDRLLGALRFQELLALGFRKICLGGQFSSYKCAIFAECL